MTDFLARPDGLLGSTDPNTQEHVRNLILKSAEKVDEDLILVPRGLLGSAIYAIRNKCDAPKTLEKLRRYTTGDKSK